jgi:hypothetical protein
LAYSASQPEVIGQFVYASSPASPNKYKKASDKSAKGSGWLLLHASMASRSPHMEFICN